MTTFTATTTYYRGYAKLVLLGHDSDAHPQLGDILTGSKPDPVSYTVIEIDRDAGPNATYTFLDRPLERTIRAGEPLTLTGKHESNILFPEPAE